MVCGNRWMVSSSQSIYLAGMVVGTVAASHTSDWFGRKKTILGGILLSVAASAMTALSTSVTMYYVSRFIVALGVAGYADVIYTLRTPPKHVVDDIIEEAKRKKAEARDIGRASVADLFSTKVWAKITTLFSFQ
ncbi:hypothetical protein MTO96_050215, partial [Rhipicephalus appendiculatus]